MSTKKKLKPEDRLIVAADFSPQKGEGLVSVSDQVLDLCHKLKNAGVYIKINSALRGDYGLIETIHELGLRVFADLKLNDIEKTLEIEGKILQLVKPEILTVMCSAGVSALWALKNELPETEVLGVTVLTTLKEVEVQNMYGCSIDEAVVRLAKVAAGAQIDGLVCAPREVGRLSKIFHSLSFNTPGIRPTWAIVDGDDQNPERIMTPEKAIRAGADRIVVGRPITGSENPFEAVVHTLEEIAKAA